MTPTPGELLAAWAARSDCVLNPHLVNQPQILVNFHYDKALLLFFSLLKNIIIIIIMMMHLETML